MMCPHWKAGSEFGHGRSTRQADVSYGSGPDITLNADKAHTFRHVRFVPEPDVRFSPRQERAHSCRRACNLLLLPDSKERASVKPHHLPIITSEALMTAQASSPARRLRSATASLVMEDVTMTPPPISMRIWDVVAPFATSTIFPLS